MVPASPCRYRYRIDSRDELIAICPLWLAFARENGALHLTADAVLGRSLWDFIDGAETKRLYQTLLRRVREKAIALVVPFRCDSPTLRRYMRLEIVPLAEGCVQFDGVLERVEPTSQYPLLDPAYPRSHHLLTICSCCKRVLVETCGWLEVEDAIARLRLFEKPKVPQLRNCLCPACASAACELPASANPGHIAS